MPDKPDSNSSPGQPYEGVSYLRKSKMRKGHEHRYISIDRQLAIVNAKAVEIGATRNDVFIDAGGHRSGRTTKNRPDWLRLKARLMEPSCRFLIVFMVDRSARCVRETAELVDLCKAYGKRFLTCQDGLDTDRMGWTASTIANINFQASAAQFQSDYTSDRMRETAEYYRTNLGIPWGMWPFGLQRTGEGKLARLSPDPQHGETARKILTWYAAGLSYDATAQKANDQQLRHLNRDQLPEAWTREAVRSVVGNILTYAGYIITRRHRAKESRIELAGEGTYLERYARAMNAVRSTAIEPLASDELASAVIERRYRNQQVGRRCLTWTPLLTPILFCDGRKLRAHTTQHSARIYRTRDGGVWIDAGKPEGELLSRLAGITFPPEMVAQIRAFVAQRVDDQAMARAQRELGELRGKLERLIALHVDGMIPRESYNVEYVKIERMMADKRAELSRPSDVDKLLQHLGDLGSTLDLMTPENQKRALHKTFERVDVSHEGEIVHLELKTWARAAFGELAFYMRQQRAQGVRCAKGAPGEI
ncbi:MAG: recombinase family protein [Chloroflexi bacterium]|nr:recombinase family protein [Chloroflexota bacterium]